MAKSVFIGFDFSMNKPACTILYDKQFTFYIWPRHITEKNIQTFQNAGVSVVNRNLPEVKVETSKNSMVVLEHTIRSVQLAQLIVDTLDAAMDKMGAGESLLYISSEGLSFNSKGDATLNLASYKGVLLAKLYEHYADRMLGLFTYAPISIKAVAGCAKKGQLSDKHKMIQAFKNEKIQCEFRTQLVNGKFIAKTNYIECVDDIVDSYFALKTMLKKEKFIK